MSVLVAPRERVASRHTRSTGAWPSRSAAVSAPDRSHQAEMSAARFGMSGLPFLRLASGTS
eukprot:10552597-Heterocapsa_arctica.AAC.1